VKRFKVPPLRKHKRYKQARMTTKYITTILVLLSTVVMGQMTAKEYVGHGNSRGPMPCYFVTTIRINSDSITRGQTTNAEKKGSGEITRNGSRSLLLGQFKKKANITK
jgi:hypothetical protein